MFLHILVRAGTVAILSNLARRNTNIHQQALMGLRAMLYARPYLRFYQVARSGIDRVSRAPARLLDNRFYQVRTPNRPSRFRAVTRAAWRFWPLLDVNICQQPRACSRLGNV